MKRTNYRLIVFYLLTLPALITGSGCVAQSQTTGKDSIVTINPPLQGFYSKYLNCGGIPIRSGDVVDDKALFIASAKISLMLKNMPATRKNLIKSGAELHIIGKDQQTSDLPEFRDQKGVKFMDNGVLTDIDQRTRGMGGLFASCGEENLLGLPQDRYAGGSDICMHEFGHTIMNFGFDSILMNKIEKQFRLAKKSGLWKDAYAVSNSGEYWAELTMWYFGKHGEFLKGTKLPVAGAESLKNYDSGGYALLDAIYSGRLQPIAQNKAAVMVMKGVPSERSTEKTEFKLINNRDEKLKLYWIDFKGKAQFKKEVPAHKTVMQSTFKLHVWMVEDANRVPLLHIRVNDPPCELKIEK